MRWFNSDGQLMSDDNWNDSNSRTLLRLTDHLNQDGSLDSMLVVIHGAENDTQITLPTIEGISSYQLLWNSSLELPESPKQYSPGEKITTMGLSVLLIKAS
jgi:glycogen operon protein